MAGTRVSSRVAAKPSPRSSPRSVKSTPKASPTPRSQKSSALSNSVTPKKRSSTSVATAKTSPYFKGKPKRKPKGRAPKRELDDSSEEEEEEEENGKALATGLTETESSSSSDAGDSEDEFDPSSSDVPDEPIESDIDSDALDEESDDYATQKKGTKRKSTGGGRATASRPSGVSGSGSASKKAKVEGSNGAGHGIEGYEDEEEDTDIELEEGQEIAGRIYPAPKTGQVPPGRISQNTLNFLKNLQIPERNDRDWFRSHEPAFRQAENEWKAFVAKVQLKFHESDDEIPILPPKDVIHRIYRDVRFSSDKTPYKRSFSLSTSRGGRKGVWAGYHLSISPNGHSIIACGVWQPGKNELQTIRHHLLRDPQRFRDVIGAPDFVEVFGPAKPHPKGKRQNVFGHDDALKVAPKGVDKEHKDIDLLKLRSVAVVHHFSDEQVLAEDFGDQVKNVVAVMAPFAHLLNDFIALPATNEDDE